MAHREGIRAYLKDVVVSGTVIDWGCGTKPIKNYIVYEKGTKFIGIDKLDHVGADMVFDMEYENFQLKTVADYAFCIEVIEHLWHTKRFLKGIHDNLRKGGVLYFSQPYHYATHKEDDRIRYTHYGLLQLLSEAGFTDIVITPTVGDLEHAEGFVGSARK